jgi:hypothetical protein
MDNRRKHSSKVISNHDAYVFFLMFLQFTTSKRTKSGQRLRANTFGARNNRASSALAQRPKYHTVNDKYMREVNFCMIIIYFIFLSLKLKMFKETRFHEFCLLLLHSFRRDV